MPLERYKLVAVAAALMGFMLIRRYKKNDNRRTRKWSRKWLQRRDDESTNTVLNLLDRELIHEDPFAYKNFLRMTDHQFEYLYNLVKEDINKKDTIMREAISGRNRLEITLRFLATGETYKSLMYATRVHCTTISRIVPQVCQAIYKHLQPLQMKMPNTEKEWEKVAQDFEVLWQFPMCIGALDGKHINFRAPRSAGSYYYNYKGNHSIVLLGLANAKYKFIYVNVGMNGRVSDGGVFHHSRFSHYLHNASNSLPKAKCLPGRTMEVPYVVVADDAFPLSTKLLKPYPQRNLAEECKVFNYRLSRARRVIENAFGILSNRFRVLLTTINLPVEKVELITLTCVALHNYLVDEVDLTMTDNGELGDRSLNSVLKEIAQKSTNSAQAVRNEFKEYFFSPR